MQNIVKKNSNQIRSIGNVMHLLTPTENRVTPAKHAITHDFFVWRDWL